MIDLDKITKQLAFQICKAKEQWIEQAILAEEGRTDFTAGELDDLNYHILIPYCIDGIHYKLYKREKFLSEFKLKLYGTKYEANRS